MKKLISLIAVLSASALIFGACGSASNDKSGMLGDSDSSYAPGTGSGSYEDSAGAPGWGGSGDHTADGSPEGGAGETDPDDGTASEPGSGEGSGNVQRPIVKQLTAAEWCDAHNYDFWLGLFEKNIPFKGQDGVETTRDGIFADYAKVTRGLETFNMHEVYVTCGEQPVAGAKVTLLSESKVVYSAVTDSTGTAYVFGKGTDIEAESGQYTASSQISESVTEISLDNYSAYDDEVEIMFVVDTTGSMGDELSYLCSELEGIVKRVSASLTCNIRLGLLFYRDLGDEYVTRKFDFVNVTSASGLSTVIKNINAQYASGGGDFPEAVDTALAEAVNANWHTNSKTKLLFHVLDAPYHDKQLNQSIFANAVKGASEKGIRIIPVAASGLDTLGQYIMRSAALLTGGTYTFLTDDSGIGASHTLPEVGAFTVEYLSDLMVRLIKGYYMGQFEEPVHWSQSESVL